jgi:hypothetical protein
MIHAGVYFIVVSSQFEKSGNSPLPGILPKITIQKMFVRLNPLIKQGRKSAIDIASRKCSTQSGFWQWTTKSRPSWKENKAEAAVAIAVFGATGTLSVLAVRPSLKTLFGIEGTLVDGPNSYRLMSILCVSPVYAMVLLAIGTVSGRHNYFAKMSMKILGRFVPKSVIHKVVCKPAQAKLPAP